jgi:hypothetical protein
MAKAAHTVRRVPYRFTRAQAFIAVATTLAAIAAGVGVFAPPASAHAPIVSGVVACQDGQKVITWAVSNSQTGAGQDMTIVSAVSTQGTVDGLPASVAPGAAVGGTTTLAATATGTVALTVDGSWAFDGFTKTVTSSPVDLGNRCAPSLQVTKIVTGDYAPSSWSFALTVVCTDPVATYPLVVTNQDKTASVASIPAGSSCMVSEPDSSGATSTVVAPPGAVKITGAKTTVVKVTNNYSTGSLQVSKVVAGYQPPASWSFAIDVNCDGPSNHYALVVTNTQPTATQTGIPAGSVCTVVEPDAHGADSTTMKPAAPVTILADCATKVVVTNTYAAPETTPPTTTPPTTTPPTTTPTTEPTTTPPTTEPPTTEPPMTVPPVDDTPEVTPAEVTPTATTPPTTAPPTTLPPTTVPPTTVPPTVTATVIVPATPTKVVVPIAIIAEPTLTATELPFTGTDTGRLVGLGVILLLLGGLSLMLGRRPLRHSRTR